MQKTHVDKKKKKKKKKKRKENETTKEIIDEGIFKGWNK